jgi:Tol biopolymer transport system component
VLLREFESGLFDLTVSKQGQFAYTRMRVDRGIMRVKLADPNRPSGAPTRLNFSTRDDYAARFSPDGQRIAIESSRSGNYEIWICDSEGRNPVQLTSFGDSPVGSPSWSPDGRQVAFDSRRDGQADIYTMSAQGGQPRQSKRKVDEVRQAGHDGHWIYFGSNRTGASRCTNVTSSAKTVELTRNGGRGL